MAAVTQFSDYEVRKIGFKFGAEETYSHCECIGSAEEEMEARVVTKKCRGVERKKKVRGTGKGTIKLSLHIPWDAYTKVYGMKLATLIEGVKAYGENSIHPNFSLVEEVFNEDDVLKLKAYPNCILESGKTSKSENGAEEVAEIELEISVMPDEYGNGVYEVIPDELTTDNISANWMTKFNPEMVQAPSV